LVEYNYELVGRHPSVDSLRRLIERVSVSPARTILIYGETGTGKGLVARMIHRSSTRAGREFSDINCAAIPGNLMESELFGHEKGAFTGAAERKVGLIEAANHGTIFLDEIREMDLNLQAKLLSLLDTYQFRRVGAVRPTSVDVRFIAATNKVLLSEVTSGKFREDLYYRLQVVALNIPSLRDRVSDIDCLIDHFVLRFNRIYHRDISGPSDEAAEILRAYPWPGNVRELENLLERIFILEDDDRILPKHLPDRILRTVRAGLRTVPPVSGPEVDVDAGFHAQTEAFQYRLIQTALERSGGNLQASADALQISRHALRHQMIKLGFRRI